MVLNWKDYIHDVTTIFWFSVRPCLNLKASCVDARFSAAFPQPPGRGLHSLHAGTVPPNMLCFVETILECCLCLPIPLWAGGYLAVLAQQAGDMAQYLNNQSTKGRSPRCWTTLHKEHTGLLIFEAGILKIYIFPFFCHVKDQTVQQVSEQVEPAGHSDHQAPDEHDHEERAHRHPDIVVQRFKNPSSNLII